MQSTIKISMRKTALKFYGGKLSSLFTSRNFDNISRSRNAGTITKKDFRINSSKDFKPWQRNNLSLHK